MKLVVLGSGTSVPHPKRSSSAYWLTFEDRTLLLDPSPASIYRMAQEGCDWANLDAIWVSHFHLDHVGGLAPFLFGTKHAAQTQARTKPLTVFGPAGTEELLSRFDRAYDYGLFAQPFPFEVRDVSPSDEFEIIGGVRATTFSTPHTNESLALRITDNFAISMVYTSDTGFTETLGEFAIDVDLLLMECSFVRTKPVKHHLVLEEAMRLASLARARQVMLGHLYPEWDGIDLAAEAKKIWDGQTIEARDGLRLELGPG